MARQIYEPCQFCEEPKHYEFRKSYVCSKCLDSKVSTEDKSRYEEAIKDAFYSPEYLKIWHEIFEKLSKEEVNKWK